MGKQFGINKVEVEIDGVQYTIPPLPGKYYGEVMEVMKHFSKHASASGGETTEDDVKLFMETVDGKIFETAHGLCVETLKRAYPNEKEEDLQLFTTQQFMSLFLAVMEANLPSDARES